MNPKAIALEVITKAITDYHTAIAPEYLRTGAQAALNATLSTALDVLILGVVPKHEVAINAACIAHNLGDTSAMSCTTAYEAVAVAAKVLADIENAPGFDWENAKDDWESVCCYIANHIKEGGEVSESWVRTWTDHKPAKLDVEVGFLLYGGVRVAIVSLDVHGVSLDIEDEDSLKALGNVDDFIHEVVDAIRDGARHGDYHGTQWLVTGRD